MPRKSTSSPEERRMINVTPGAIRSASWQWHRGDIIQVETYMEKNARINDEIWTAPTIWIILAIYDYTIMTAPISRSSREDSERALTTMQMMPKAEHHRLNASEQEVFIHGDWKSKGHLYVDILRQVSFDYVQKIKKLDQLEPRSIALLLQRNRLFHNMAYIPNAHQIDYFRAMMTRDAIYQPEADGSATIEYLVTTTGSYGPRDSLSSESGDLLHNDLGSGVDRGDHDMNAAKELLIRKPSLKRLLSNATELEQDWEHSPLSSPEFPDASTWTGTPSHTRPTVKSPKISMKPVSTIPGHDDQQAEVHDKPSKTPVKSTPEKNGKPTSIPNSSKLLKVTKLKRPVPTPTRTPPP